MSRRAGKAAVCAMGAPSGNNPPGCVVAPIVDVAPARPWRLRSICGLSYTGQKRPSGKWLLPVPVVNPLADQENTRCWKMTVARGSEMKAQIEPLVETDCR